MRQYRNYIAVAILIGLMVLVPATIYFGSIGYLTGAQGLEAQFNSVYYNGAWWSTTEKPAGETPSDMSFGYSMSFDPDGKSVDMPNLCGSQQPMTLDTDVAPLTYTWDIKTETGKVLANNTIVDVYKQFEMYRYRASWAINIWMSGPSTEAWNGWVQTPGTVKEGPNYGGTKLWLKLVPKAFVYFKDNPDQVFFAPAYIGLAQDVSWVGIKKDGTKIQNDAEMLRLSDLIPAAQGETVGIYYARGGADVITEETLLAYQGLQLDPAIFRNEYWMRIDILNLQPLNWWTLVNPWTIGHGYKYPSGYLKFTVYLFVVGVWTVQIKTGEVPELGPHTPPSFVPGDMFKAIVDFFNSPLGWLTIFIALIMIVLVIVAFSGALPAIIYALGSWGKGRKR